MYATYRQVSRINHVLKGIVSDASLPLLEAPTGIMITLMFCGWEITVRINWNQKIQVLFIERISFMLLQLPRTSTFLIVNVMYYYCSIFNSIFSQSRRSDE